MEHSQKDDFSLGNYRRCLAVSKDLDYNFYPIHSFEDALQEEKSIIMRHDVDTQLDVAVKMSKIEREFGIRSTYFFRLHSHSYNIFCLRDFNKIKSIMADGHEIGLHYESDFYHLLKREELVEVRKEINIFNNLLGCSVSSICPHEPTRSGSFTLKEPIKNIIEAYDENILKKFKYISDSSCRWREGSFYENIISGNYKKLYILTHPYWWYENSPIENY